MRKIFTVICFLAICALGNAQDPHYSQFFSSPMTLNPALTGKFDGSVRLTGNYRNQWPSINNAFITTTGAVDFHIGEHIIPSNDNWGLGAVFLSDKSAAGAVNASYFSLSTAYHKGLDDDGFSQLSVGLQGTYSNTYINVSDLKFGDQLTSIGFSGSTAEFLGSGSSLSSHYFDMNAGVLFSGNTSEKNNFYGGISVYHINKPTQQFGGEKYTINPRATVHAGGYFAMGPAANIHVSGIQTFQGGASETVIGGAVQLIANPDEDRPTSLYVGSWLRFHDALIPYLGLEFSDVRMGITYDVNTSSLKTASGKQGGIELSLVYTYHSDTDRPIKCPKF
ncbi:PorP/SprF family type IX secretion system membrane protein [Parasediminibacterium sp. JCM 36343]|uniref:PorP/SprF family type IX secretion system membrane protein n=1 Tax=Parasediminibacterium sp. JCM 36343 TaxID=3374279 RepID=UPI00397962DE